MSEGGTIRNKEQCWSTRKDFLGHWNRQKNKYKLNRIKEYCSEIKQNTQEFSVVMDTNVELTVISGEPENKIWHPLSLFHAWGGHLDSFLFCNWSISGSGYYWFFCKGNQFLCASAVTWKLTFHLNYFSLCNDYNFSTRKRNWNILLLLFWNRLSPKINKQVQALLQGTDFINNLLSLFPSRTYFTKYAQNHNANFWLYS